MSTTQNSRKYTQRISKPTNETPSNDALNTNHQQYRSKANAIQPNSNNNYSPKQSPKRYIKRGQRNPYHHSPYDDQPPPPDYPSSSSTTYHTNYTTYQSPLIPKPDEYIDHQLINEMELEINKSLPPGLYNKQQQPSYIIKEYRNQYHPNQTNNSERNPNWRTKQTTTDSSTKQNSNRNNSKNISNSNRNTNNTRNTSNTSNITPNNHRFERIPDQSSDNQQKFYYQPRPISNKTSPNNDPLVMIGELKQSPNYPSMYSGSTPVHSPSSSSSTVPGITTVSPKISSDNNTYHRTSSKNNGDDQIQTQSIIEQSASDLYEIVYIATGNKPDIALPVIKHCLSNISSEIEIENVIVDELKPKYTPEWLLTVAKNYVHVKDTFNLPKSVTFAHSISEAGRRWQENNTRRRYNPKRFARTHSSPLQNTQTNEASNDTTDNSSWRKVITDDKITDDDINDILHIKQRLTADEIEKQLKYEQHHDDEYEIRVITPELKPNPAELNINDDKTPEWMTNNPNVEKDFQFIILDKERDKKHMKEHDGQLPINSTFVTEDEYHRRLIKNKHKQIKSHEPTQEILIVSAKGIEKDSKENALLQLKLHQQREHDEEGQQPQPQPQQKPPSVTGKVEGVSVNEYPPQIRATMIRLEQDIQKITNYLRVAQQPEQKARCNKHLTKLMTRKQEYIEWWRVQQKNRKMYGDRHSPAVVSVIEGGGSSTAVVYGSTHGSDSSKTRQIRSILALKKAASLEQVDHFEKYYRKQLIKMQQQAKTDPKYSNYVEYYNRKLKTVEKRRWELKNYLRMNEIRKKGQLVLQRQGKDAYQKYVALHLKEFDVHYGGGHGYHGKQLIADISHNTSVVNNSSTILNVMDNMLKNKSENIDVQGLTSSQNIHGTEEIYLTPAAVNDQRNTSAFWDLPAGYTKVQQQRKQSSDAVMVDEQVSNQPSMVNNQSVEDYDAYMGISNVQHVARNAMLTSQTSVGSGGGSNHGTHGSAHGTHVPVGTLGKKLKEAQMNAIKEKKRAEKLKAHIRKHALKYVSKPPPIEDQIATREWYQNLKKVENIILEKYTRKIHKANIQKIRYGQNAHLLQQQQQQIIHNTHIAQHSPQMRVQQQQAHSPRRVIYMNSNSGGNRSPHTMQQQQSPSHMMRYDQNGNPVPVTVAIPMTSAAVPVSTSSPSGVSPPSMMHVMYQPPQHSPSNEYAMRAVGGHAYGIPSPPMVSASGSYYASNSRSPQQHVLVNSQMSPRLQHSGNGSPGYYTHHMNADGVNAVGGSVGGYYPSSPPTHSPTGYTTHHTNQLSRGQSPRYA